MTADSKRRSFPEFAKLLSKEPGWGGPDEVLQELLGGFLLGGLVEVTWPRGDVPYRPDGVHLMTIRHEMAYGPDMGPNPSPRRVNVPVNLPPQEAVSRDEWLQAFRAFGEQDRRMGADWSLLADISISEYPLFFRQAYIDWLYTTDDAAVRWLRETGRPVPGWLRVHREGEQPKTPPKAHRRPGRPTFAPEIENAYRDLKGEGQVDFSLPKTVLYRAIRERICNRDDLTITMDVEGRPRGLGNEAMRLVVTPLFEADLAKARR